MRVYIILLVCLIFNYYLVAQTAKTSYYKTIHELRQDSIIQFIPIVDLTDAILRGQKKRGTGNDKMFLSSIKEYRTNPDSILTSRYVKDLQSSSPIYYRELMEYWDNDILNALLKSELEIWKVAPILEMNSSYWSVNSELRSRVYQYLKSKTSFDENAEPSESNFKEWSIAVKLMSITRDKIIIDYLLPLLDNETVFKIEDWTKFRYTGTLTRNSRPDTISVRVCDVALISLLRAINQTEYRTRKQGALLYSSFILKLDFLGEEYKPARKIYEFLDTGYDMRLVEKTIKLSPELKARIETYISEMK